MFYALQIWISDLLFKIYVPLHSFTDNVIERVKGLTSALYQYFFQQQDRQPEQNDNNEDELPNVGRQQDRQPEQNDNNEDDEVPNVGRQQDQQPEQNDNNEDEVPNVVRQQDRQPEQNDNNKNKEQFEPQISINRLLKAMFVLLGFLFVVHALQHNPRQKGNLLKSSVPPQSPMSDSERIPLLQQANNQSTTEICWQQFPFENISTADIFGVSEQVVSNLHSEEGNEQDYDGCCNTLEVTQSCTNNLIKRNSILSFNSAFALCDSSVKSLNTFGPHKKELKKEAALACVEENPTTKASQFCHKAAYWAVQATNQLNKRDAQPIIKAWQFIRSQWHKRNK